MSDTNFLHGLRGVAALIVFISHASNAHLLSTVFGHGLGRAGVAVFFVLSGFLMGLLYLQASFPDRIRDYAAARTARIAPLYLFMVTGSFLLGEAGWSAAIEVSAAELPAALLFIKAPSVFWTVPVEVQFYVLFVLLWFVNWRWGRAPFHALCIVMILVSPLADRLTEPALNNGALPLWLLFFAAGVLLGAHAGSFRAAAERVWRLGGRWPVPIAALAFCVIAIPGVRRRLDLPTTDTFQDPITIACVLVVFAAAFADPLMRRLLSTRPAVFLGEVSFSFYLCHKMFILVAGDIVDESTLAGRMFGLAIAFGLTLGFAVLTHRLLETPSRTWLRGVLSARSEVRRA